MRSVYYSLPGRERCAERDETEKVWDAIADPEKIVVVAEVAPAVRAAWGEALGLSREEATVGKIMDALEETGCGLCIRYLLLSGPDHYGRGNGIPAEIHIRRAESFSPMFTSCCPGWVRFLKSQYPHLVPLAVISEVATADVRRGYEEHILQRCFGVIAGEDVYGIRDAMCCRKRASVRWICIYGEYAGHDVGRGSDDSVSCHA